jgi:hypothetical protein
MKENTAVIRFFESHRWLLNDRRTADEAGVRLRAAKRSLALTTAKAARVRAQLARSRREQQQRRLMATLSRSPAKAICHVFGSYCRQALQVARCESGSRTGAQNGQYLGLFQMGSSARQLYGHGGSALDQAKAAYQYFVRSGRDWSPWSCKPWT